MRANHCMCPNAAPLLNRRKTTKHYMIANLYMPTKRGVIGKNNVIANNTIMRHMRTRKEQTMITNNRFHCVNSRSRMTKREGSFS